MALAYGNEVVADAFPAELEFNSPSVAMLARRFAQSARCQILDLGAPAEANVAFFADAACRIYVEDLFRYLIAPREKLESTDSEDQEMAVANALAFEGSARFDLVLAWDLFTYMDFKAVELVMARVARCCHAGTLLFLTLPTDGTIASVPARICMDRSGHLRYRRPAGVRDMPNPRLSPTALQKMMPGFRLLHSFLVGERMQEFLFSFA
ncbi:MAG: hypothetical protein GTO67_10975 [Gammaproteobacteria bacterium]|nr:hypothetical protein [Gammaproteobacteria bacterium]NIM72219.1 hypothetical protein [Gammaproteobacteria bacterium]NIN39134.1 hypothetical protein [Gammaproteobacteria bacterium]NIO23967.1 hypothetical protein [Gammaproteobacteria bacterium]NIO64619.1 hypothetical protein [Gammaproteobacteria bacterium]